MNPWGVCRTGVPRPQDASRASAPFCAVPVDDVERAVLPDVSPHPPHRGEVAGMNTPVHGIAWPAGSRQSAQSLAEEGIDAAG